MSTAGISENEFLFQSMNTEATSSTSYMKVKRKKKKRGFVSFILTHNPLDLGNI